VSSFRELMPSFVNTLRRCHPAARRLPGQVVEQRGLARFRLPADHEHATLVGQDSLDEPGQARVVRAANGP
jgi:hypothetical protein